MHLNKSNVQDFLAEMYTITYVLSVSHLLNNLRAWWKTIATTVQPPRATPLTSGYLSLDRQKYLPRAVTMTIENNLRGTTPL